MTKNSKCNQIRSFLRIWSHLLKDFLIENFFFVQWLLSVSSNGLLYQCRFFVIINAINSLEYINRSRYTVPSIFYLFQSFFLATSTSYIDDKKIKAKILNGYDKSTRPYIDNEALNVDFDMKIQKIVKFVRGNIYILNSTGFCQ